jgi:hypothetical protein
VNRADPHNRFFVVKDTLIECRAVVKGNRMDLYPANAAVKIKALEGPAKLRTKYIACPDGMYRPGMEKAAEYVMRRFPEAKEL